jgi:hypothetical protein
MKKVILVLVVVGLGLVLMVGGAFAAEQSQQSLTINAAVSTTAKLSFDKNAVSFPNEDPDSKPIITSTDIVTVDAKVKTSSGSPVTLRVLTGGDLQSGLDAIAISNVAWTATGAGFVGGTMSTASQSAGSWTNSGNRQGTFTYKLTNSWSYATGNYSATATYTLTAP